MKDVSERLENVAEKGEMLVTSIFSSFKIVKMLIQGHTNSGFWHRVE